MAGTQSPSLNAPFTPDAAVFCKPGECQKLWTALQNGGKRREFGNWFQQSTQKLSEKVLNGNLSGKDVTVFVNYMCLSGKIVRAVSKASKDVNVQISAAYSFAVDTERENGSDELAMGCSYPGKPFPCGIVEANLLSDVMANNHLLTERDAFIRIQEKSVTRGQCFVSATQCRRAHAKRNEHAPNIDNFSDRFSARSQSSVVVNRGDSTATRRCLTAKRTRSDDRVENEMELHSTESRDVEGLKETILNGHDFYERVKRIKQETGLEADLQDSEAHYMVVTEGNEGRPEEDDGETSSLEDDQAMDGNESCLSETDAFMHTASVNHSANDSEEMGANSSGGEDNFSGRDVTPETSGMGQCDLNTEADFTESAGPSPLSATMKTPEGAVEDDVEPPSPNPANDIEDVCDKRRQQAANEDMVNYSTLFQAAVTDQVNPPAQAEATGSDNSGGQTAPTPNWPVQNPESVNRQRNSCDNPGENASEKFETLIHSVSSMSSVLRNLVEKFEQTRSHPHKPCQGSTTPANEHLGTSPHYLTDEVILNAYAKAGKRRRFASRLNRLLFTERERLTSNVSGTRGKNILDVRKIQYIQHLCFKFYKCAPADMPAEWSVCLQAIDHANRSLKSRQILRMRKYHKSSA